MIGKDSIARNRLDRMFLGLNDGYVNYLESDSSPPCMPMYVLGMHEFAICAFERCYAVDPMLQKQEHHSPSSVW